MRYWRTGILCGLLVCLGCGTLSHSRAARPAFVSPPNSRIQAPDFAPRSTPGANGPVTAPAVPDMIQPTSPPVNGPTLNGPIGKNPNATRVSTFHAGADAEKYNPPPKSGYIELAPPGN